MTFQLDVGAEGMIIYLDINKLLTSGEYVDGDANKCFIPIFNSETYYQSWTFGNIFMQFYYTVFDMDNEQIGLGLQNPNNVIHNSGGIEDEPVSSTPWGWITFFVMAILVCMSVMLWRIHQAK